MHGQQNKKKADYV